MAGTASTQLINNIPDELIAYGDASLLRRVFQNLVANAIKYTPRGEIVIGAARTRSGRCRRVLGQRTMSRNPGRPARIIFDKLKPIRREGWTRSGLTIVKTFVEAHGRNGDRRKQEGFGSPSVHASRQAKVAVLDMRGRSPFWLF